MGGVNAKPVDEIAEHLKTIFSASEITPTFEAMCSDVLNKHMTEEEREELYNEFFEPQKHEQRVTKLFPYTKEIKFTPTCAETEKNSNEANKKREQGNIEFKNKKYHLALLYYTHSIAVAPVQCKSNSLALAYANRSAVLKALGLYTDCIADVERALSHGYPTHLRYKIILRQGQCYVQLGLQKEADTALLQAKELIDKAEICRNLKQELLEEIASDLKCKEVVKEVTSCQTILSPLLPNLDYGVNNEIPVMSSCVQLKYNSERGRHLVATHNIQPGKFITNFC